MMSFRSFADDEYPPRDSETEILESALISPGVAKATALGILFRLKSLSGQVAQMKGPDAKALSALSTQLVLLGTMVALGIGTLDSDAATGTRR